MIEINPGDTVPKEGPWRCIVRYDGEEAKEILVKIKRAKDEFGGESRDYLQEKFNEITNELVARTGVNTNGKYWAGEISSYSDGNCVFVFGFLTDDDGKLCSKLTRDANPAKPETNTETKNQHKAPWYKKLFRIGQSGSTLLWAIGALVLLSVTGAMVAKMTPSTLQGKLEQEAGARAYYNANSGLNYILGMQQSAQASGAPLANFVDSMGNGTSKTMDLSGTDSFSYQLQTLNSANSTYQITNLVGTVKNQGGAAAYAYQIYGGGKGSSGAKEYTVTEKSIRPEASLTDNVSGKSVKIAGTVIGDVISESLEAQSGSSVTGSVTLTSTTQELSIHNGMNVATDSGSTICSNYGINIDGGSNVINGNIYSPGDASNGRGYVKVLAGSTINGNIYANNTVTLDGNPKIYGQIHSQEDIQVEDATIGKNGASQNLLCKLTPTVTGGEKIYTDINSQEGIVLQNITIKGNLHYKTLLKTDKDSTHWTGTEDHNPTLPTPPLACSTYSGFTSPVFTATDSFVGTQNKTFTAGTYYYTEFKPNWSSNICFDTSGGDINILVSGETEIQGSVKVKSSSSGSCSKITLTSSAAIAAAPYIFFYTGASFKLDGSVPWVGTVLAYNNVDTGSSDIVGSLHSMTGTVFGSWYNIKVVGLHP